ncbi:MAG: VWA domain-containing protein, partial [Planctomycetes bacterium]|nr:VWA domain-containing protein [Planctomycetota bacterium]
MKHGKIFRGLLLGLFAAGFAGLSTRAMADGMIVPIRHDIRVVGHWAVNYHHVDITVRDQVANVSVDQEFVNTGSGMIEVEYLFPVPPDAAIDSMTLLVNGKEFTAKLMKADEARKIYEDIVRRKKDPALLEYVGFGLVKTSAFPLEPNKPANVVVTYKQPCKKDHDVVQVWYPLNTEKFSAKAIDSVKVKLDVKSKADLTNIYSPTHDISIKRDKDDPHHVVAIYEETKTLPTSDFQVFYKEADEDVGATLLTHQPRSKEDGYYMMLVSPNPKSASKNVIAKDVLLVIDHSGSMREKDKIGQAKEAVTYILKNLNDEDRFNVVSFSDAVDTFFDDLVPADKDKVKDAIDMLDRVDATGGTAIHEALQKAMKMCSQRSKKSRPAYIIFMTDGLPTIGKTNEKDIIEDALKANDANARVFALGVGYDVNTRLLDKLVQENNGKSDYVKPKEKIETKMNSLYAKIKNPVMTDVKVDIKGLKLRDNYPRKVGDLFDGDQIVMVGRYDADTGLSKDDKGLYRTQLVISGNYEGKEKVFEYSVSVRPSGRDWKYDFVEKLWALRRVGWLLDQIQSNGDKKELIDEVIRLSRDYGIMTPYTAFLADENTPLADTRMGRDARH